MCVSSGSLLFTPLSSIHTDCCWTGPLGLRLLTGEPFSVVECGLVSKILVISTVLNAWLAIQRDTALHFMSRSIFILCSVKKIKNIPNTVPQTSLGILWKNFARNCIHHHIRIPNRSTVRYLWLCFMYC